MSDIPADAWPAGEVIEWGDDTTRTHHDFLNETTRPYTAEENADADARAETARQARNGEQLRAAAADALAGNRAFLALTSPTQAQTLAQVKAITRQINALARLVLNDLTGTD